MAYIGTPPQSGFITTAKQRVTSSTNNYVDLDNSISSLADVIVWVNSVKQDSTNLTLTTSTRITLGGTLTASDVVEIAYLGKAVATQTPATGTVTNDMLAGSIANDKLVNSSITLNGSAVSLGGSATVGGDNTPSFGATASSTQSISNGGFVKVTLDTENWDTDSAFDNATNYRFTVPTDEGGKYLFNYGAYLVSMTTNGYFQLQLYKNGSQLRESAQRAYMSSTTSASMSIVGSITTSLAAGDYIEFYVIQDNSDGGGGSRTLSDANYKPFLTGFKLIGV
jgi:hypothetical protein